MLKIKGEFVKKNGVLMGDYLTIYEDESKNLVSSLINSLFLFYFGKGKMLNNDWLVVQNWKFESVSLNLVCSASRQKKLIAFLWFLNEDFNWCFCYIWS